MGDLVHRGELCYKTFSDVLFKGEVETYLSTPT